MVNEGEGEQVTVEARQGTGAAPSLSRGPVRSAKMIRPAAFENAMARLGVSYKFLAGYLVAFHLLFVVGFTLAAVLIFWSKSANWLAALLALTLVMFAARTVPEMYLAAKVYTWMKIPVGVVGMLGVTLPVWLLYLFPNGKFAPRWTVWPAVVLTLWYAAFFLPKQVNPIYLPSVVIFLVAMTVYGIAVGAQVYRYVRKSSLVQRQQTKWAVLGFAGAFLISYLLMLPVSRLAIFRVTGAGVLWSILLNRPLYYIGLLLVPLTLTLSILDRHLWNVDVVINRAAIYTVLLGLLGLIWNACTALLDKILGDFLEARSEMLSVALSGFGAATLFLPIKNRLEKWINKRFYPDRVDFDAALVELRPDVVEGIALPDLFHVLVTTVPTLLQCKHAAIFDLESGAPRLRESFQFAASESDLGLGEKVLNSLCRGNLLHRPHEDRFPVVVPLHVPRGRTCDLIGILAIGPRAEGRGFSRDHLAGLSALGARAGTAIHILRLRDKRQEGKSK